MIALYRYDNQYGIIKRLIDSYVYKFRFSDSICSTGIFIVNLHDECFLKFKVYY